ncbi:MAG: response regulator, partial [Desulfamplus sp.]|nr:response regulator [Desulfamplus sp.]
MFKLFLTAYGYNVFVAEDGQTGLEMFEKERPQIVFTDLKMPGMDGIEVLRNIRAFHETEVIIITGHGDMEKAVEALDLEASDFINKPVEKRALESALKRAELRIKNRGVETSELILSRTSDSAICLRISGKLTGASSVGKELKSNRKNSTIDYKSGRCDKSILNDESFFKNIDSLSVEFSADFSINRDGFDWLVDFMECVKDHGISITMTGLSYNYIRLFQMAGLHEFANIIVSKYDN